MDKLNLVPDGNNRSISVAAKWNVYIKEKMVLVKVIYCLKNRLFKEYL